MKKAERIKCIKKNNETNMPKAKTFDEFVEYLVDFLSVNEADFAIYVGDIGALPKTEERKCFAMFNEQGGSEQEMTARAFAHLATMFAGYCTQHNLDLEEELRAFVKGLLKTNKKYGNDLKDQFYGTTKFSYEGGHKKD